MKRRPLVALVSLCVLLVLGAAVLGVGFAVVRSRAGQERLRAFVEGQLRGAVNGSVHLGRISGGLLTDVTIDTVAIRGPDGALFLSTGRIQLSYDPRDLVDRRILLRSVSVEHPWVHLRQYEDGDWNYKRVFKRGTPSPKGQGRSFGDFIVAQAVKSRGASFVLTLPWHPADSLRGARRDSAIAAALAREDAEIRPTSEEGRSYYARTYRWTNADAELAYARLAHPDSAGRLFEVTSLAVDESDPPFRFRNVRASVRHQGDTVWLDVPHFDLPGSTGRAEGKVVWGSGLPNRYDIRVVGDSVSLRDVAWVYPTLPREGGGKMHLHIRNDPKDLHVIEYALSQMDVRSTQSRLVGTMTYAVGGPVLVVKDVDLDAAPVDFALVRTLNGKPFPVDWQGTLTGHVRARGGPLNRFVVDESDVTFRDRHVPDAVTRGRGRGMLDILFPAFTAFRGFRVEASQIDLRSIEYLFPNFPRLGGIAAGVATLDSSWLDVRFSDADVTHRNGPGEPSRLTGSGRVTWGEEFMTYDVALQAQPLSLPMFARAYPALPVHGQLTGPIRAKGTAENLDVVATLTGDAGTLFFDGNVDSYPPGLRARGRGGFAALDLRRLVDKAGTPSSTLTGQYEVDLTGDSLANASGRLAVRLERSTVDGMRIFPSLGELWFADGRVRVDSLRLATVAGTIGARGALGLRADVRDSLTADVVIDSLGGLRRYLAPARAASVLAGGATDSSLLARALGSDSLGGTVRAQLRLQGSVEALDVAGTVSASGVRLRTSGADTATGTFAFTDVLRGGSGTFAMRLDTVVVAGIPLDSVTASVQLADPRTASFALRAQSGSGPWAAMYGRLTRAGDTLQATVDTLDVALEEEPWRLAAPVRVARAPGRFALDTLTLAHDGEAHVRLWASALGDSLRGALEADSLPLAQFGTLLQARAPMSGEGSLRWTLAGTVQSPLMQGRVDLTGLRFGGMQLERVVASADYRDRRADASVELFRNDRPVLTASASLPVSLVPGDIRRLGDSLSGQVRADAADFAIVEAFSPTLRNARGRFDADFALRGTWGHPRLAGRLAVQGGEMDVQSLGIRLMDIGTDVVVGASPDAMRVDVRRLAMRSGAGADTLSLTGWLQMRDLLDMRDASFDLRLAMRNFHAIDRRSIARLDVSTGDDGLRLQGRTRGATLTGTLRVDRGSIFIPDVRGKQVLSAQELEALAAVEGTMDEPQIPLASAIVERLTVDGARVEIGDEVWLRSREANVKLGGSLNVTRALEEHSGEAEQDARYRLALEGALRADRGTYTLELGLVQREFQVERGTINWLGGTDVTNPVLDISALHRVKQADRPDIRIRARLTGFVRPAPILQLESAESYQLSQSDLVSYLVTGRPSFDAAARELDGQTAADVLLPTLGTYASQLLRGQFGLDAVQLQAGATLGNGTAGENAFDVLTGLRLGGEKQIRDNLFFSLSTGLCALNKEASSTQGMGFMDGLAGSLEYRFPRFSLQVGREPPASALSCGNTARSRGVIPTPSQWGVSLSRSWRF